MEVWMLLVAIGGGYVASIYTWPKVKVFVNGATLEAQRLRDKARAIEARLKG